MDDAQMPPKESGHYPHAGTSVECTNNLFFKSIFKLLKDQITPIQLVNNKKKKKNQPEMTSIRLVARFKFFA